MISLTKTARVKKKGKGKGKDCFPFVVLSWGNGHIYLFPAVIFFFLIMALENTGTTIQQ